MSHLLTGTKCLVASLDSWGGGGGGTFPYKIFHHFRHLLVLLCYIHAAISSPAEQVCRDLVSVLLRS